MIVNLEDPGIDRSTFRMLSGRSTIWANPPASAYGALGQDLTAPLVPVLWLKESEG